MPEEVKEAVKEEVKKDDLIDVGDADEKATEIDLDKKEGGEVKDEKRNKNFPCEPDKSKNFT